jgi:hypothetical protein
MNTLTFFPSHAPRLSCSHALAIFLLVLAGLPTRADTSFTATGWLSSVPLPGITCSNSSGVYLKGNVHALRLLSNDARVTGRLQAWMDLAYQPDGSAIFSGPACSEVGTWDSTGASFTPSGGLWALNYSGVIQADGSTRYNLVGYGMGGSIEGLRISVTATRTNSEATTPYLASGTIKPAPVQTSLGVDNFDNNHFDPDVWWNNGGGAGTLRITETNQQLTIAGTWRTPTVNIGDYTAWVGGGRSWSVPAGQTLELRADLASLSPANTASAALGLYNSGGLGFGLTKGSDWLCLWKEIGTTMVCCTAIQATTSDTNVVLVFAVTTVGSNVQLTGKVLDKVGNIMSQLSWVDTPAKDPSLTASEMNNIAGGRIWQDVGPDAPGAPWKSGASVFLAVFQNSDGTTPLAEATFDNVELRTYEMPQLGIERAVRLSWPNTGIPFGFESAPTVQGPWLPVLESDLPGMRQLTVPANNQMRFFRPQQAP